MASNFVKRKLKEKEVESVDLPKDTKKSLTRTTFDVIIDPDTRLYYAIVIQYDSDSKDIKMVDKIKLPNKVVAQVFLDKKQALATILKIKGTMK